MSPQDSDPPVVWLIDGFNVLHTSFFGEEARKEWWRAEHRERLIARVARFNQAGALYLVFDGSREPDPRNEARPVIVFAPSADDWILKHVPRDRAQGITVVTQDRKLADRARHRGAEVWPPQRFLEHCPDPPNDRESDPGT